MNTITTVALFVLIVPSSNLFTIRSLVVLFELVVYDVVIYAVYFAFCVL